MAHPASPQPGPAPDRSSTDRPRPLDRGEKLAVVVMLGLGVFIGLLGAGILPASEGDAPPPIAFTAGGVFFLGGLALAFRSRPRANAAFAGLLMLGMAALGGWVSLFGADGGFSGGIPLLPPGVNVALGRAAFGFGALVLLAVTPLILRRAWRGPG